jgi:hypothetical protein
MDVLLREQHLLSEIDRVDLFYSEMKAGEFSILSGPVRFCRAFIFPGIALQH